MLQQHQSMALTARSNCVTHQHCCVFSVHVLQQHGVLASFRRRHASLDRQRGCSEYVLRHIYLNKPWRRHPATNVVAAPSVPPPVPLAEEELLSALTATQSYSELAMLIYEHRNVLVDSPMCVYTLLHAILLRDTVLQPMHAALKQQQAQQGGVFPQQQAEEAFMTAEGVQSAVDDIQLVGLTLEALCDALQPHLPLLPLGTQAAIVLGLAQLEVYDEATCSAVTMAVVNSSGSNSAGGEGLAAVGPQEVEPICISLAAGLALVGHYEAALFDAVAEQATSSMAAFSPRSLATLVSAFLDVQHYHGPLLSAACEAALHSFDELDASSRVSLLLAAAFFQPPGAGPLVERCLAALCALRGAELSARQAAHVYKSLQLLRAHGQEVPGALDKLVQAAVAHHGELPLLPGPPAMAGLDVAQLEAASAAGEVAPELVQEWRSAGLFTSAEVAERLLAMGHVVGRAGRSEDGIVPLDMTLEVEGRRLAVVVLDEQRYCNHPPNRLKGQAALDVMLLQALGWVVVPLPVREWQAQEGEGARDRYLRVRLQAACG